MTRFGSIGDPPASFVLAGVRVVDPESGTDAVRDLAVLDGRLAPATEADGSIPRLDAGGLIAAPAFCDLHTHLRQPGAEDERDDREWRARGGPWWLRHGLRHAEHRAAAR